MVNFLVAKTFETHLRTVPLEEEPKFPTMVAIDALVAFVLTYLVRIAYTAFSSTGSTVILNDIYYYIPPDVITILPTTKGLSAALSSGGFIPLTATSTSVPEFGASDLSALISNFSTIEHGHRLYPPTKTLPSLQGLIDLEPYLYIDFVKA